MLDVRILIVATPLVIILACCSSAPPSPEKALEGAAESQPLSEGITATDSVPDGIAEMDSGLLEALRDSLDSEPYDYLFLEIYSEITSRLAELEEKGEKNSRLIEARAIITVAEEVYLEGDPVLAIKLLSEAELILRQAP
jgi:hypothetical protein